MFTLDTSIPEPLRPLAWLIGEWEGAGVVGYPTMEESFHFGQQVSVTHDGRGFLEWQSRTWILDSENGERVRPSSIELGFWRPQPDGEIEFMLAHPTGIVEMYYGSKDPEKPIVNLRTDGVLRSATSKEYSAATRLYGLVDSQLMWVMDMAAMGVELTSHVSAQLKRVE